ncbi:MAG: glycoside hydrolase family 3 C-terminal domain-containing protein [Bacteroidetes bacterium]|nr:glycoside hydrolase family 3 C-terminal domain-containing protein [Bacteroidota bacterium]
MKTKKIHFYSIILSGIFVFIFIAGCKNNKRETIFSDKMTELKIDSILSLMTLEEKIGQMTLFTSDWDVTGPTMQSGYKENIRRGRVGAIFNAYGVRYVRDMQRLAVDSTRLHIPLMFGYDVIHGYKSIFPIPLGEAASWDMEAIEKSARIAAIEASAEGLNWTFAPMVDIARDPRWGRISEGAGEDPYLGSMIAKARVKGFQNNDLAANNTLLACAKHYVAYGAAIAGRDYNTVDISDRTLRETYLPPFHAAVEAGVGTIMSAFNEINGIPATGNRYTLRVILKDEWKFQGFVVTDYTSINEMVPHGIVANEKEAGELALNAGVDMDMQGAVYNNYLSGSIKEGKVDIKFVDDAVRRILRMKYALGLFDDPYRYCDEQREKELVMSKDNLEFARKIAKKSIVLLKNKGHLLPLRKETGVIAVIGPLADNKKELIGSWSAAGDYNKCITLLKGIERKVAPETKIIYSKGCNIDDDSTTRFDEAIAAARQADVVIVAVGEGAWMSGEAASRSSLRIPGVQEDLVKRIYETGKPVVVVLMNGRPLTIAWMDSYIPAILETWFLGTMAGDAIADVLFGDYNPSGKLPVSFPRSIGQVPLYYNFKNTGRPISESKWTSKYLDMPNTPLYPFGYGLSYTDFKYSEITLSDSVMNMNGTLKISVTVANTGQKEGEETVQLYIRDMVASITRPVKELKGFRKISLKPGESRQVDFEILAKDLMFYDSEMKLIAESGEFKVFVGTDSENTKKAGFVLK